MKKYIHKCKDTHIYKALKRRLNWFIHVTLRDQTDPILGPIRRKSLKGTDFTIISNNCWGGHVYRWYDLPYQSPTIGLYFWAGDYMKFISDLPHYIGSTLEFILPSDSVHYDSLKRLGQLNVPIGKLDDIEIIFLHYKSKEEAREKWERRCKRINWNHILVKNSYMNDCTPRIIEEFQNLPYICRLFFVGEKVDIPNTVVYGNNNKSLDVKEDTIYFNKYIDLTKWINSSYM